MYTHVRACSHTHTKVENSMVNGKVEGKTKYSLFQCGQSSRTTFTFSNLADALIQSDLQYRDIPPKASRVKYLAQGHNVILRGRESNW